MKGARPYHFLFAIWMVGGVQTIGENLKETFGHRSELRASWLDIEMYPDDWITRVPPISLYGMWQNAAASWLRMRPVVRNGGPLDAAYFLEHSLIPPHWSFMRKTPYVLATDMTPLFCARHKLWYAVPEFDPTTALSRLKQEYIGRLYRGAHHLLPFSSGVRDSMVEEYGVPEERVTILPPGIDLTLWDPPDRALQAATPHPLKVLHVGWDYVRKGADLVVDIAGEPEWKDVEFHFVTGGIPGTMPPNVRLHMGIRPNDIALVELYRQADIFVLPTRADVFSMVALEAMAMNLPVITTRVGGIGDIVDEGVTGFCIASGDRDALRDRLRRLRTDADLRVSMGHHGRLRVQEKFNLARHAETLLDFLVQAARSRVSLT